jgi:ankyrin repeat protein
LTELLIEVGANLEMKDEDGETPLYFAARNGHVDCVEALLKDPSKKADINVQDTVNGYTPLMVAGTYICKFCMCCVYPTTNEYCLCG